MGLLLPSTGGGGAAGSDNIIGPIELDTQVNELTLMSVYVPDDRPVMITCPLLLATIVILTGLLL